MKNIFKGIDIENLTLENLPDWPINVKIAVIVVSCIAVIFLAYWLDISSQIASLHDLKSQETTIRAAIETEQQQAANISIYKAQLKSVNDQFKYMLNQLPNQSEVPKLLEYISQVGAENGLVFKLFKPLPEVQKDFFVELPIQISVTGDYHQLAHFVSDIAALPRIVTMHDFTIAPQDTSASGANSKSSGFSGEQLQMDILAKTYRYTAK